MLYKCNLLCIICSRTPQPGRRRGKGNVYISDLGLLWQNMVGSKLEKLYNGEVKHYCHCLAKMHATHQAWTAPAHLTTTTAITTLVYLQAMIGNGVLLNCTNAYGRSASSFKEVNDGTPHKLPATTLIPHECKDEDTCVFIFALRNLTELDTGNYICSSLSHIYHLNVTGEYLELLCVV